MNKLVALNTVLAGTATETWAKNVLTWVLGIVLIVVGMFLIIRAVLDLRVALGSDNKEWGKAAIGVIVGVLGGWLAYMGTSSIISLFKATGNDIPKS